MENILHKRLIGQDEAVAIVSDSIRRARSGLKDPKRPIGTFLFLGPTGVGKTELAKSLAEFMFNDEDSLIRIDMSEYMEKHNVARLVGAPPGYVGYDEGGQLTEATKEKVIDVLRTKFKPEFLNRIDETIFFKALSLAQLSSIVDIQINYLRELLKDQELNLEITEDAKDLLATRGFNPVYGARPLKRIIRQMVENPLSKAILSQKFSAGDTVVVDVNNDEIIFEKGE